MTDLDKRHERGIGAREAIMGADWTSSAASTPGLAAFTEHAVEHVWSAVWGDEVLELQQKSLATISALVALGHLDELRPHAAGALRLGLFEPDQLRAVVLHLAPYVGYPQARHAMVLIEDVIVEHQAATGG